MDALRRRRVPGSAPARVAALVCAAAAAATASGGEGAPVIETGLAARFPGDAGIASDPAVIMADDFESWGADGTVPPEGTWHGVVKRDMSITHVIDGSVSGGGAALPGRRILEIACWHRPAGEQVGGVQRKLGNYNRANEGLGDGFDEVYVRYYLRFGGNYRGVQNHGANVGGRDVTRPDSRWVGMANTRDVASQGYFFSGLQPYGGMGAQTGIYFGFYSYHMDKPDQWGDSYGMKSPPVEVDRWYCLERHMKLNAVDPVAADGIEELWIDGVRQIRKEGLRFRRVPQVRITFFSLETYYHGLPEEFGRENPIRVYFDNVVIATKYVGPTAFRAPPSGPSRAPSPPRKDADPLSALAGALAPVRARARAAEFGEALAACAQVLASATGTPAFEPLRTFGDGLAAGAQLKDLVVARAATVRPRVYVEVGGVPRRVVLLSADERGARVDAGGTEMDLAWRAIAPRRFYGIATKLVDETPAHHLMLARYCATMQLAEEAREELGAAAADPALAGEVRRVRALVD